MEMRQVATMAPVGTHRDDVGRVVRIEVVRVLGHRDPKSAGRPVGLDRLIGTVRTDLLDMAAVDPGGEQATCRLLVRRRTDERPVPTLEAEPSPIRRHVGIGHEAVREWSEHALLVGPVDPHPPDGVVVRGLRVALEVDPAPVRRIRRLVVEHAGWLRQQRQVGAIGSDDRQSRRRLGPQREHDPMAVR